MRSLNYICKKDVVPWQQLYRGRDNKKVIFLQLQNRNTEINAEGIIHLLVGRVDKGDTIW